LNRRAGSRYYLVRAGAYHGHEGFKWQALPREKRSSMFRQRLAALSAIIAVFTPGGAAGNDLKFHSRECKLMLALGKFDMKQAGSTVGQFWDEKLTRIIAEQLDKRKDGTLDTPHTSVLRTVRRSSIPTSAARATTNRRASLANPSHTRSPASARTQRYGQRLR
jgi:hypothetical protein